MPWILCLAFLLLATPLYANISNEGNDAVQIEITSENGSSQYTRLYPDQTIALPIGTKHVRVPSFSDRSGWGDENIKIKIVEENGKVGYIESLGGSYELNREDQEEAVVFRPGIAVNNGNIPVDIIIRQGALSERRTLYMGQPITLPKQTTEVRTVPTQFLRGDEIINVAVILPTGKTATIERLGGYTSIFEDS